jgi:hypothetical protein
MIFVASLCGLTTRPLLAELITSVAYLVQLSPFYKVFLMVCIVGFYLAMMKNYVVVAK